MTQSASSSDVRAGPLLQTERCIALAKAALQGSSWDSSSTLHATLFSVMADNLPCPDPTLLPLTGCGHELEMALSAICIDPCGASVSPRLVPAWCTTDHLLPLRAEVPGMGDQLYGTRTSTVCLFSRDGSVEVRERDRRGPGPLADELIVAGGQTGLSNLDT